MSVLLVLVQPVGAYTGDVTPAVDTNSDPNIFETTLIADETFVDLGAACGTGPCPPARMFAFNGIVPGPQIKVKVGDRVIVHLINLLDDEAMTLHWHGLHMVLPTQARGGRHLHQEGPEPLFPGAAPDVPLPG